MLGIVGDLFSCECGQLFIIKDNDNDGFVKNCVMEFKGVWWYQLCYYFNLNGFYYYGQYFFVGDGVNWYYWKGY